MNEKRLILDANAWAPWVKKMNRLAEIMLVKFPLDEEGKNPNFITLREYHSMTNLPGKKTPNFKATVPYQKRKSTEDGFQSPTKTCKVKKNEKVQPLKVGNMFNALSQGGGISTDLSDPDMDTQEEVVATVPPKIKPILAVYPKEYRDFVTGLKTENQAEFKVKVSGEFARIFPATSDDHRAISEYLLRTKIQHYVQLAKHNRPVKIVVKGLPLTTDKDDLKWALEELGYGVKKVAQLVRKGSTPLPIFQVHLSHTEGVEKVFDLTNILYTYVTVEAYKARKGPSQCHRCQKFNHSSENCFMTPRCVRCGGEHLSSDCPHKAAKMDKPMCANSQGPHPASYKGCPKYKNFIKKSSKTSPNPRSFTSNSTNFPALPSQKQAESKSDGTVSAPNALTHSFAQKARGSAIAGASNRAAQATSASDVSTLAPEQPRRKPSTGAFSEAAGTWDSIKEILNFFKVRKAFKSQEIYENFLRCLVIYNQELISRQDLVLLVSPFLSKYSDLYKWFKDFLGYKENNNTNNNTSVDIVPKKIETQERERVGDFATEIDYSSCVKYGASYRAVPRNYVQPKCSGRTALCHEVLNDTWVSFPSWSEDSTFVSSRKTQFEEYIYRCEDERFEFDVVLETNLSTIRILEAEMAKINRMSPEEKARYRLDDTLGGSSSVIQQRAIKRIYGDKAGDIIEGLKKNPVSAVPLVLRRLKAKEEEWRKAQKSFNKIWREQNEKYYLKSLDHQGINFKQNDVKFLRCKSILNEIETIYEERHEQVDDGVTDVATGPHLVLQYKSKNVFKDAANLVIHHVKRQTGTQKEDKQKIKHLMRQFFPDFFSAPRGDLSDDEVDKDDDMETEDGNDSPKSSVYRDLLSLNLGCSNSFIKDSSNTGHISPSHDDKSSDRSFFSSAQSNTMDNSLPDESYTLMFANNNWYVFFRLHHILCERLWKIYECSQILIAEELRDQEERKQSTALALRLKPRTNIDIDSYYPTFLDMVKNLLDGNIESSQYEDNLREMFGIHAYLGFTLDKVIQNAVRQLQHIVGDDPCTQLTNLFLEEAKRKATGGACSTSSLRSTVELVYQKKAEQLSDENLFKIIVYKQECKLTIELLDTDSDVSEDQSAVNKWNAFVRKYVCEDNIANILKDKLAKNPIFLPRQNNNWLNHAKNMNEEKETDYSQENDLSLQNIQDEIDESKIDLSRLEDGGAGEAVKGLVGLNAKAKYLERTRLNKITENGDSTSNSYGCRFNVNSYKMTWIVDSEECLYRKKSLSKALQSHQKVSQKLGKRFHEWHQRWLLENVQEDQEKWCKNWLLGLTEDNIPTTCIRVDNFTKPPYSSFNRYKVQAREKT
ncbi:paired amphipathic helix protein Sin3a-like [Uloborus diversus]|uniref:paired amphipathic helix protein Sin3a-like n=1 Tax=Uloborus diversus TaxID=327109 RepID=UPI002408FAB2|nr:paired amphipathic helix protein Sin3a-like [Uloborus diversus]